MAERSDPTAMMPDIRVPAGWTMAGLVGGLSFGLALGGRPSMAPLLGLFDAVGSLWLRALQMTIVPLVVALLVTGVMQTVAAARAGAMARRTLGMFLAILFLGAVMAALVMPALLAAFPIPQSAAGSLSTGLAETAAGPVPGIAEFIASLVPTNIVASAASDAMLPLIVFFSLFALAATRLPERAKEALSVLFESLSGALMVMIGWVLAAAPIGVFALALGVAAKSGTAAIGTLAHYIVLVTLVGTVVMLAGILIALFGARLHPVAFGRAMAPVLAVAISTQSSLASLPAMLAACRKLDVRESNADFVLPLAVALFRATGPAMNLAVAIYVAKLSGVEITPAVLAAGIAVATLTTLGAVSLPGALSFVTSIGPIAIAMGAPVGPLALLVAVEMLPDIMRTLGNVVMDVAVTATVDRKSR